MATTPHCWWVGGWVGGWVGVRAGGGWVGRRRQLPLAHPCCRLQPNPCRLAAQAGLLPAARPPLQAFLCLGWHVEWALEVVVQATMLAVVMQENEAVCSMPVSASWRTLLAGAAAWAMSTPSPALPCLPG